jgi:hypothetical protein
VDSGGGDGGVERPPETAVDRGGTNVNGTPNGGVETGTGVSNEGGNLNSGERPSDGSSGSEHGGSGVEGGTTNWGEEASDDSVERPPTDVMDTGAGQRGTRRRRWLRKVPG